jgi:hypothetical protein
MTRRQKVRQRVTADIQQYHENKHTDTSDIQAYHTYRRIMNTDIQPCQECRHAAIFRCNLSITHRHYWVNIIRTYVRVLLSIHIVLKGQSREIIHLIFGLLILTIGPFCMTSYGFQVILSRSSEKLNINFEHTVFL